MLLLRRRVTFLVGLLAVTVVGAIAVQLAYPHDQALPRALLAGEAVGGEVYDELIRRATTGFETSQVTVTAGSLSTTAGLGDIGAVPEMEATVKELVEYPTWQRFIPFSMLFMRPEVTKVAVSISQEQLEMEAEPIAQELSRPAENARLTIADGELTTTSAAPGQTVAASAIVEALSRSEFRFGVTSLEVASEAQVPTVSDDDIAAVRAQAEAVIRRSITITAPDGGTTFTPEPATIASWLTVIESPEGGVELSTDKVQLQAYIAELNDKVGIKPGITTITLVDGKETGRTEASPGKAIAAGELIAGLEQVLFGETAPQVLAIRMVDVPPIASYDRSYTSSQQGLRAYVEHVTSSENIKIAVSQVGGKGWSAQGRADEQLPAASTYKLYVAAMLFHKIKTGAMSWKDNLQGTDIAGCLERIIVVSDNPCAEALIDMFGATHLNNYLYGLGISRATTFISEVAAQTTAADLEKLLRGIENGSIIGGADRTRLLDAMERQKYRAGVPAGSAGRVQDKVGFLWDYLHDAAIVRHPKGTYVVVILTKDSSWGRIAEITRELERIMYS